MSNTYLTRKTETWIDRSSTITSGGVAQTLMGARNRGGFWVHNLSTGDLYINEAGTATTAGSSIKIPAGALYECPPMSVPSTAISIYGATTGQAFSAREW